MISGYYDMQHTINISAMNTIHRNTLSHDHNLTEGQAPEGPLIDSKNPKKYSGTNFNKT